MKSLIVLLLLTLLGSADLIYLAKAIGPDLYGSSNGFENVSTAFVNDYHRSGKTYDDALDEHVSIGFNFPFNGQNYSEVIISSNGVLYFRASGAFADDSERGKAADYSNHQLSSSDTPDNAVVPYWDDMDLGNSNDGTQGQLLYGNVGSGDDEHFVVWWDDVTRYNNDTNNRYSFQVALYKNGTIIFRYKDDDDSKTDGSSATIGIKEDGSHYDQNTYNTSNIDKGRDIVYRTYKHLSPITPQCTNPVNKVEMSTYDNSSSHPRDEYLFAQLRIDNTTLNGNGYQDQINGSGNPYDGSDDYYWTRFGGYIYLPDTGVSQFGVEGDDAVEIYLDEQLITGWYGGHGRHNHEEYAINADVQAGWHKLEFNQEERSGGDNYYLYWKRPGGSMEIVPSSRFYHCEPTITKTSCVINDPVNSASNPKRIPGGTIRYAVEVQYHGGIILSDVHAEDNIDTSFDESTITNLKIDGSHACNCLSPISAGANGGDGGVSGNTIKLDFDSVAASTTECGYFEVDIR
jgi:hypothetical protein